MVDETAPEPQPEEPTPVPEPETINPYRCGFVQVPFYGLRGQEGKS